MARQERTKLKLVETSYFVSEKKKINFVSSGCTVLDCALGGGYPLGRMVNIVGDKSTAKTGLATEALTNFVRAYPNGVAAYRETEAAFDRDYAKAMGLPIDDVDFGNEDEPLLTVEEFMRDIDKFLDARIKTKTPGIYVLDSIDSLSDEAELEADPSKGTYGTAKAKMLSKFFRTHTRKMEQAQTLFIVVSQTRENIGAMFGEKYKRSGGKALDFYATQIIWLAHLQTLQRTINKIKQPYGIEIKANVKKNKIGLPFRKCEFSFIFGYGVEDLLASIGWLKDAGRLKDIDLENPKALKEYLAEIEDFDNTAYRKEQAEVAKVLRKVWQEVEVSFLPKRTKY